MRAVAPVNRYSNHYQNALRSADIAGNLRFPACSQNTSRSDDIAGRSPARGQNPADSGTITRELRSLERQRVPEAESAEGFLDPGILCLNTTPQTVRPAPTRARGFFSDRDKGPRMKLGVLEFCSRAAGRLRRPVPFEAGSPPRRPLARREATPSPRCPGLAVVRESDALS